MAPVGDEIRCPGYSLDLPRSPRAQSSREAASWIRLRGRASLSSQVEGRLTRDRLGIDHTCSISCARLIAAAHRRVGGGNLTPKPEIADQRFDQVAGFC